MIGFEAAFSYLCSSTQHFVIFPNHLKEILDQKLMMEEIPIPKASVSIVYGYVQRIRMDWHGKNYIPNNQISLLQKQMQLKDSIIFLWQ